VQARVVVMVAWTFTMHCAYCDAFLECVKCFEVACLK